MCHGAGPYGTSPCDEACDVPTPCGPHGIELWTTKEAALTQPTTVTDEMPAAGVLAPLAVSQRKRNFSTPTPM